MDTEPNIEALTICSSIANYTAIMSERKVLSKYYPPDFDPAALTRKKRGPKPVGPKVQTVRLMAPFSMKCTSCGEYIYKGRKFNARKEIPENERYLGIQIFRFYIRCTRCSAEITFKTDPKNQDYTCERGAKRSTEPWRQSQDVVDETDEQRLDRLAAEEEERNAMEELEAKTVDAKREMAVADALDEIRTRNARLQRAQAQGDMVGPEVLVTPELDEQRRREDEEDAAAWARAQGLLEEEPIKEEEVDGGPSSSSSGSGLGGGSAGTLSSTSVGAMLPPPLPVKRTTEEIPQPAPPTVKRKADENASPAPSFKRQVKRKKEVLLPGIKKKSSLI